MSKRRRGMSLEEKRAAMLSILHETKEVYTLKELEKLGNKAGVVPQTVKDVLQCLVDDNLIELEKIGSSNYYWSFPSKALRMKQNKVDEMKATVAATEEAIGKLEEESKTLAVGREEEGDAKEREEMLTRVQELEEEEAKLARQIAVHKENDPRMLDLLRTKVNSAKQGANRWTDNAWEIQSFLKSKHGLPSNEIAKMMGMKDDFDYPA